jgi:hypothetical protein
VRSNHARPPLGVVIRCAESVQPRVRYVFDTLFMACGVPIEYLETPPPMDVWILYAPSKDPSLPLHRCIAIANHPDVWGLFDGDSDVESTGNVEGVAAIFPQTNPAFSGPSDIPFDVVANAFYFLSSWSEHKHANEFGSRQLWVTSVFARLGIPQDIVDRYLELLMTAVALLRDGHGDAYEARFCWPSDASFAVVLSHDVDFLPSGLLDNALQGSKSVLRHLVRQREPMDALRAGAGLLKSLLTGQDPYGCVPEIVAEETRRGVRSSFQVAVARRHPADVNYNIRDDRTRDYLRAITRAGFDLCLHGSYRSTEQRSWYVDEAALLGLRLERPLGSRQHFLSFDYDTLFAAQEEAGIQYDMSMGFPDRIGPRAGFSYPYFPFSLARNRPYDVVEISLFFMDVTLQGYMGLRPQAARDVIELGLRDLQRKRGAVSVVWHPIVFGGARDPGYDRLYWDLVERVQTMGGVATDGRTINAFWRDRARGYTSF